MRILLVGYHADGRALADDLKADSGRVGVFLDDGAAHPDVLGPLAQTNHAVAKHDVDTTCFAIPSIDGTAFRTFVASTESDTVQFAMVPRTYNTLTRETDGIGDHTDVDVPDLVGRKPVKRDLGSSRDFVCGKKSLVTGPRDR